MKARTPLRLVAATLLVTALTSVASAQSNNSNKPNKNQNNNNNNNRPTRVVSVPEPGALALLVGGLVVTVLMGRRSNRRKPQFGEKDMQ